MKKTSSGDNEILKQEKTSVDNLTRDKKTSSASTESLSALTNPTRTSVSLTESLNALTNPTRTSVSLTESLSALTDATKIPADRIRVLIEATRVPTDSIKALTNAVKTPSSYIVPIRTLAEAAKIPNSYTETLRTLAEAAKIPNSYTETLRTLAEAIKIPNFYIHSLNAIAETVKLFPKNDEIELLRKNLQNYGINNQQKILNKLESINYLKELVPDLNISSIKNNTIAESSDQNISIPITNVDKIVSIKKMSEGISLKEAIDFHDHLVTYPMLGYMHDVGKQIFDFIAKCNKTLIADINLFRLRVYPKARKVPFSLVELIGPPFGVSPQNRFNNVGLNVSYFSENMDVLKQELDISNMDRYSIIKVNLVEKVDVLDIRDMDIPVFELCQKKVENIKANFNIEYILPNYVSECAKMNNFKGILYKSTISDTVNNYAFFYLTLSSIKKLDRYDCI